MHTIISTAYRSCRNLVYYRRARRIPVGFATQIERGESIEDIRRALTDALLATVGLKTVDSDADCVPRYIPLSTLQKSWVQTVTPFGYKVGLR
ncbi:MAG TPA: hypothetical protein VJ783_18320 [Pirellulales bacterium]|nr:hypothetical protein [Pirellulales bacterium]